MNRTRSHEIFTWFCMNEASVMDRLGSVCSATYKSYYSKWYECKSGLDRFIFNDCKLQEKVLNKFLNLHLTLTLILSFLGLEIETLVLGTMIFWGVLRNGPMITLSLKIILSNNI